MKFFSSDEVFLKKQPATLNPLFSLTIFYGIVASRFLLRPQTALLKSRAVLLLFALFHSLCFLNSWLSWLLQSMLSLHPWPSTAKKHMIILISQVKDESFLCNAPKLLWNIYVKQIKNWFIFHLVYRVTQILPFDMYSNGAFKVMAVISWKFIKLSLCISRIHSINRQRGNRTCLIAFRGDNFGNYVYLYP